MKYLSPRSILALLVLLGACSATEEPRPVVPPPRRTRTADVNAAWQQRTARPTPSATPTSSQALEEAAIMERGGVIIPDDADIGDTLPRAGGTPTQTPASVTPAAAAVRPQATEPEVVAAIPRQESLLPRIAPGTPPNQAAALRVIEEGRKLIDARQYDQATDRLERGVSIDPTNAYGYYYLAQVNYLKKDYSQAVAFAGRAVALSARNDRSWVSRAYTLQAEIFEEVGRYRDARNSYTRAVQADPNNLSARVGAARVSPASEAPAAGEAPQ